MLKVIASHILISDDLETRKVWYTQYADWFNFNTVKLKTLKHYHFTWAFPTFVRVPQPF